MTKLRVLVLCFKSSTREKHCSVLWKETTHQTSICIACHAQVYHLNNVPSFNITTIGGLYTLLSNISLFFNLEIEILKLDK
jgi:hypothetical protein